MGSYTTHTLTVLVLMISYQLGACSNLTQCDYISSCGCQTNEGVIDLNSLSTDKPYEIKDSAGTQTFYWEPCQDFTLDAAGFPAGAYQNPAEGLYYDIGTHSSAASKVENGAAIFTMTAADLGRTSYIKCECADSVKITFDIEDPVTNYKFTLKAPNCCVGSGPSGGGGSGGGLSPGSLMVIIFFSLLIVYFLAGFLFQTKVKKAEGKERIPQVAFWSALPGLVKDGVKFTFTCGKSTPSYDKI